MSMKEEHDIAFYRKHYPNNNGFRNKQFEKRIKIGKNLISTIERIKPAIQHQKSRQQQVATALEILSCCNSPYGNAYNRKKNWFSCR